MESRELDLISRVGKSSWGDFLPLQPISTVDDDQNLVFSVTVAEASLLATTSSAQIVNPLQAPGPSFTLQSNPPGEIAPSLQLLKYGSGPIRKTCRRCKTRGHKKEHWRYCTDFKLRFCNACGLRNKREEQKAKAASFQANLV